MRKLTLVSISFAIASIVTAKTVVDKRQMSQQAYLGIRTVKVCAYDKHDMACGTGFFVDRTHIVTAYHVVAPMTWKVALSTSNPNPLPAVRVMRSDSIEYEEATVESTSEEDDLALLRLPGISPSVSLSGDFHRGQKAYLIGNPSGRDFVVVETQITGVDLFLRPNGKVSEMVTVDAKDGEIRPGFSGGAVLTDTGVVGVLQMCSSKLDSCIALESKYVTKMLKEKK